MRIVGYTLSSIGGYMLADVLSQQWDWKIIVACFASGVGGVLIGYYG